MYVTEEKFNNHVFNTNLPNNFSKKVRIEQFPILFLYPQLKLPYMKRMWIKDYNIFLRHSFP